MTGVATAPSGTANGVLGQSSSPAGYGVLGTNGSGGGVLGSSTSGNGVTGSSATGFAMQAMGDTTQSRTNGGWAKAMVRVDTASVPPTISRCFNSQAIGASVSTPPCGMSVTRPQTGYYQVNFGFQISDRFLSLSGVWFSSPGTGDLDAFYGSNTAQAIFSYPQGGSVFTPADPGYFFLIVY